MLIATIALVGIPPPPACPVGVTVPIAILVPLVVLGVCVTVTVVVIAPEVGLALKNQVVCSV